MFKNFDKIGKGFTLMEVMVAIFVTLVGVVGIYSLVPRLIAVTSININRFTASQLAREGIELVRNIRDSNWLGGFSWDNGLTGCSTGCEADYDDGSLGAWAGRNLNLNGNGFYVYDVAWPATKFKRKITITVEDSDILRVKAEVSWPGKYSPFALEEQLYNWR